MKILRIKEIGQFILYERVRGHETTIPRYVVGHADGRMLEEFRRYASAEKWAKSQAEGGIDG